MSSSIKVRLKKISFKKMVSLLLLEMIKKYIKEMFYKKPNELLNIDIEFKGEWKIYKSEEQFCFTEYSIKQEYSTYFLEI